MGNENSQLASGSTTPQSEYSSADVPVRAPPARRSSNASTAQHSPVEQPDVDLSHLDDAERAQIVAVIARAREMQEEETQRVRDLDDDDFTSYAAGTVVRSQSMVGGETSRNQPCPICREPPHMGEEKILCTDCQRSVCGDCGAYDKSPKSQEWLCLMCGKRRNLVRSGGIWHHGHVNPDTQRVSGQQQGGANSRGHLERSSSLPEQDPVPEPITRRHARPMPINRQGSLPTNLDNGPAQELRDRERREPRGRQSPDGDTPSPQRRKIPHGASSNDKKNNGAIPSDFQQQSPRASDLAHGRDHVQSPIGETEEENARRKSPRPKNLVLSRQHSSSSGSSLEDATLAAAAAAEAALAQPVHSEGPVPPNSMQPPTAPRPDIKSQPRTVAEGAEAPSKKKPSALERMDISHSHHETERSQSPSRRSPRSPPRSPSWLRYRESPPRSPPVRGMSPPKTPTERFPNAFMDIASPPSREETYGEEYDNHPEMAVFHYDQQGMIYVGGLVDMRGLPIDKPPPKPARLSDQYDFRELEAGDMLGHSLDLAAYAATVASDTEHLTNLSVSPTNLPHTSPDLSYLDQPVDHDSISPPSPNYLDEGDEVDMSEDPTPKSIDYQGSKRQKVKPPPTDWSPITDLSPILDVSPSLERLEQEKMLQEQQHRSFISHPPQAKEAQRKPPPVAVTIPQGDPEPEAVTSGLSPLKRYQSFEDITKLDVDGGGYPEGYVQSPHQQVDDDDPALVHSIRPAKDISQEIEARADPPVRRVNTAKPDALTYVHKPVVASNVTDEVDREIDVDGVMPPQKRDPARDSPVRRPVTTGRAPPEQPHGRKNAPNAAVNGKVNGKVKQMAPKPPVAVDNNGRGKPQALVGDSNGRSKPQALVADSNGRSKPQALALEASHPHPDATQPSPQYHVLKSPPSPSKKVERIFSEKPASPSDSVPSSQKAYMYPSPVTPPDPATSPPQPRSPSARDADRILASSSPTTAVTSSVTAANHSPSPSPVNQTKRLASGSPVANMKAGKGRPESPGSPGDKKVRRKLPSIPPADTSPPGKKARAKSSDGAARQPDRTNADKELLRKRLQERGAIQAKPVDRPKVATAAKSDNEEPVAVVKKAPPPVPKKPNMKKTVGTTAAAPNHKPSTTSPNGANGKKTVPAAAVKAKVDHPNEKPVTTNPVTTRPLPKSSAIAKAKIPGKPPAKKDAPSKVQPKLPPKVPPQVLPKPKKAPAPLPPTKATAPTPPKHTAKPVITVPPPPPPEPELVIIHGISVPVEIKSFKQRIKEELQIATATKRLELDEIAEIRRMERELEVRERERKIRIDKEEKEEAKLRAEKEAREKLEREREELEAKERREAREKKAAEEARQAASDKAALLAEKPRFDPRRKITPPAATLTSRMSPQASPRRARHKRQNSDPMIAKFSPIEEDRDIESEMSYKLNLEAKQVMSDISKLSPRPMRQQVSRRLGSITPPPQPEDSVDVAALARSVLSKSSEMLSKLSLVERDARLSSSQSESCLPMTVSPRSQTPTYFSDDDDRKRKEEKKHHLQLEIHKRKAQMEENARLQYELRKLVQSAELSRLELEEARTMYQHHVDTRDQTVRAPSAGIIRPIDYQIITENQAHELYSHVEYAAYREQLELLQRQHQQQLQHQIALEQQLEEQRQQFLAQGPPSYSSNEYMTHKIDPGRHPHQDMGYMVIQGPGGPGGATEYMVPEHYIPEARILSPTPHIHYNSGQELSMYADKGDGVYMTPANGDQSGMFVPVSVEEGMMSQTGYSLSQSANTDHPPIYQHPNGPPPPYEITAIQTEVETTTPGDATPAMPILEEVTKRSRNLLRDIGSRPLSDDMEKYFQAEDPLNTMFRTTSDHSIGGDSDENIMEGGVTIMETIDQKKPQPPPISTKKYDFATKRILLTRDPKDRTIKGNGMGMRIVGGKVVPDGNSEVGAYVAAIYPGGVADQLHGELQEGDQVLEWNGTVLTGLSYEEVQQIISLPNGEIELVVKPGAGLSSQNSTNTMSTLRTDSCHSSYDNIDFASDYDDFDRYLGESTRGIDPDLLAQQLEDMQGSLSPGGSHSSSQQDMYLTPSVSMSSSEQTDTPSPSVEVPPHVDKDQADDNKKMGEIQLQLSYDDYDGTLNVHVIQARNVQPKDTNGFSDPFVKVYLLPGRNPENKRRTKYIARTLDPEWHQTLVFMNIPRVDLTGKSLEITVWDYDRFKPNDFLGEVLIDLAEEAFLDNKPHWYILHEHDENNSATLPKPRTISPPRTSTVQPRSRSRSSSAQSREMMERTRSDASPGRRAKQPIPANVQSDAGPVKYSPGLGRRKTLTGGRPADTAQQQQQSARKLVNRKHVSSPKHYQTSTNSTMRKRVPTAQDHRNKDSLVRTKPDENKQCRTVSDSNKILVSAFHETTHLSSSPRVTFHESVSLCEDADYKSQSRLSTVPEDTEAREHDKAGGDNKTNTSSPLHHLETTSMAPSMLSWTSSSFSSTSEQLALQARDHHRMSTPDKLLSADKDHSHPPRLSDELLAASQELSCFLLPESTYSFRDAIVVSGDSRDSLAALLSECESFLPDSRQSELDILPCSKTASPASMQISAHSESSVDQPQLPVSHADPHSHTSDSFPSQQCVYPASKRNRSIMAHSCDNIISSSPVRFRRSKFSTSEDFLSSPGSNRNQSPLSAGLSVSQKAISTLHSNRKTNTLYQSKDSSLSPLSPSKSDLSCPSVSSITSSEVTNMSFASHLRGLGDTSFSTDDERYSQSSGLCSRQDDKGFTDCCMDLDRLVFSLGPGQIIPHIQGGWSYQVTGEVLLGVKLRLETGDLTVNVVHCRDLSVRLVSPPVVRDWYVKLYLTLDGKSKRKKRKTRAHRSITDPAFHEYFTYQRHSSDVYLEVSLWQDRGVLGKNKAAGTAMITLGEIDFTNQAGDEIFAYYKLLSY